MSVAVSPGMAIRTPLGLFGILTAACATGHPVNPCDEAADLLAECGHSFDQSPFGTCPAAQQEQAQQLVGAYREGGCDGLSGAQGDGFFCSVMPFLCVEHSVSDLESFETDGCSMFPDGTLSKPTKWQHCCIQHDFAYYVGGPEEAREEADNQLASCVAEASGSSLLGSVMYYGVRLGGTPALPTPWRWGYGWDWDPFNGYRALPLDQLNAAQGKVAAYKAAPTPPNALEQRTQSLLQSVLLTPGLSEAIAEVQQAVNSAPE